MERSYESLDLRTVSEWAARGYVMLCVILISRDGIFRLDPQFSERWEIAQNFALERGWSYEGG